MRTQLGARRAQAGLTQGELAARAGISRQALGLIESGRSVPSTVLALRLGAILGRTVEDLFAIDVQAAEIGVSWREPDPEETPADRSSPAVVRGLLARVGERWVAHPLFARDLLAADVIRTPSTPRGRAQVLPGSGLEAARTRLLISGCAPALGLLVHHLGRAPDPVDAVWIHATTEGALEQLGRSETHVAGVHFPVGAAGSRSRQPGKPGRQTLTLAGWQEGLLVRRGDRRAPRRIEDLGRSGLRLARRERGASANRLLDERLAAVGITWKGPAIEARGHFGVAQAVALGAADVAVAAEHAALAYKLDFIPLGAERFDLLLGPGQHGDRRYQRLADVLASRGFRDDLATLGGYDTTTTGSAPARPPASDAGAGP